ncbi:hypothetical protein AWM75_03470 [Aerococcus urinaehominis]|uniref:Uncharacterized protein n=1 Tax=Aerococcus urinaehominis TaxID=128944 RepID=A0A0X8FKR0_9LACT|nr:ZinT/AdcA family metal-binding protein [Aerococcus urinaehominis]AMB99118.1 hypothetical protein AWM75_03470 [Aerococcus urinaehominis]SDM04263.1 ZinT (YodA) lipocalin-like zinc-recruitment [Aerococcus urinaehominis]
MSLKKLLLMSLSSGLLLAACGQNNQKKDTDQANQSQTSQAHSQDHSQSGTKKHDHDHGHDHEVEISKDNVVAKEGDHYLVAHGDHYHEVAVDQVDGALQKELDQYLADHPNLKAEYEKKKEVYAGYFKDEEVADRTLADWQGEWQSVYPYLLDGTLDPVMEVKSLKSDGEKTAAEYKDYYKTGYQTDVKNIKIEGNLITFIKNDGSQVTGEYEPAGTEILAYEKGNRGVRPLFTKVGGDEDAYQSVQFSDHNIAPTEGVNHFHIYFSNDTHQELLKELDNWPTYYPAAWSGEQILEDQLNH